MEYKYPMYASANEVYSDATPSDELNTKASKTYVIIITYIAKKSFCQ